MQIGDRVRFLDDIGGGIISRIDQAQKLVYVEDQDGFEVPARMSQVVVVNNIKSNNLPMTEKELLAAEKPADQPSTQALLNQKELSHLKNGVEPSDDEYETDYGDTLNLQLAFAPQNIRLLQSTPYDAVLINDSNYYLLYNIATIINGKAVVVASGLIEPNMTDTFYTIEKEQLNDWERFRIQAIPFKQSKPYEPQHVVDADIKLNLVNFFKLHAFTSNEYFDQPAWLINLLEQANKSRQQELIEQSLNAYTSRNKEQSNKNREQGINRPRHRRIPTDEPLEIDLHINELVDNTNGMSNGDMLQYQLDTFHRVLKENLRFKGKKIVFIHGKGEGVLRKNIEDALRKQYKTCRFQDASFQKYGFGATMVIIG